MGCRVVNLRGLAVDALTEAEVVAHVLGELDEGRGGRMVPVNVDVLRAVSLDPDLKRLVRGASLMVADGMPLVWATRLSRTPVPERVTGASLIFALTQAAAGQGRSIYLLGGAPGVPQEAGAALCRRHPSLAVAGTDSPPLGFDATDAGIDAVCARLAAAAPDIVYVGLGFPKQERLIARVASELPSTWFVACGAAIAFAAGAVQRAPRWMQQAGLEWLFRLATEPRRLAQRYLVHDLPFAASLIASCVAHRFGLHGDHAPAAAPLSAIEAAVAPATGPAPVGGSAPEAPAPLLPDGREEALAA